MGFRQLPLDCFRGIRRYSSKPLHEYFHYSRAIVGSLNNNFIEGSIKMEKPGEPIDLAKAKVDHGNYVEHLRTIVGSITHIPQNHQYPDHVFVEDPAVLYDGKALLTNMKMPSRYGERFPMKQALESLGLSVYEMKNPTATLDGGDVLFTGREFLIGLSSRTNKEGIEEFAQHFPNWSVTGITVKEDSGVLHLKSMCSLCCIDTIAIGNSEAGQQAWKEIVSKSKYKYIKILFPDNNGSNCLFVNGVILHPSEEDYPKSYKIWKTFECETIPLQNGELIKADGSLTCCSILIN